MHEKPEEFLNPWLEEGRGKWFNEPVKQTRFYCSETFYDWYPDKIVNRVTFSSSQKSVNIAN